MADALAQLTSAVSLLTDEARVLELAVRAMHEACGRGIALGFTARGARSERPGLMRLLDRGAFVPLELPHLAYVRTPAYDLADVPEDQRNRWVEPFREGIATHESWRKSTLYPLVRRFGVLEQGRVAICAGERQVALVGVGIPEGTEFSDDERARLRETGAALVVPLRVAALVAASSERSPLVRMLDASEEAVVALDARGRVIDASRAAFEILRRDRALPDVLGQAVATMPRPTTVVRARDRVIHVSPCVEERAIAFLAVLDGAGFAEAPVELTDRQRELLRLLERGLTNAGIASAMGNAPSSVKTMLERLYERTGTSNRVELLAWWRAKPRG